VTTRSRTIATWSRYLGALALLGVGVDHLEQFSVDSYSAIPTIGTLFALNFASAALIAAGLAAPIPRLRGRAGRLAVPCSASPASASQPGRWPACWSARASACSGSWRPATDPRS
jgi:hypothetical protein